MNYIKIYKSGKINVVRHGCLFCKKRLLGKNCEPTSKINKNCLNFFSTLEENKWGICPFGYSSIRVSKYFLCGCFINNGEFNRSRKKRASLMNKSEVDILQEKDSLIIQTLLQTEIYLESYSAFAHDFSHSIGFLKTHLESCAQFASKIPSLQSVIDNYNDIIRNYSFYNDNYISRPKIDDWISSRRSLDQILDNYNRKKDSYEKLVNNIKPIIAKTNELVVIAFEDVKASNLITDYEKNQIQSMLHMNGLFQCQLDYAFKSYLISKNEGDNFLSPSKNIDIYKTLQKLVYLLKTPAKSKDLEGIFINGNSHSIQYVTTDIFLGFFILLENSLKYAKKQSRIQVEVCDLDDSNCLVNITNNCDYISQESLLRITEIGFRGENSNNKESHGMGLAIAKVIFEQPSTSLSFSYKDGKFSATVFFQKK